ncbi:helix-turn-helix domain-containing protein [Krasilnikovia sp. MM14-A1259]|uniref:helix-turn-helix domain-containing protein n=1 Tax=Krasilnikovia sp. MM14-A1259 TaxID=3373539 RepID=UPI00382C7B6A
MPVSGPTVVRRQLGRRLQRLREAAGKTAVQVEEARLASRTKVWRIEAGKVPVRVPDVWALCRFYEAAADQTEALATLAVGTSEQGWWEEYGELVPDWFKLYVGLETAASRIQTFEDGVVPGELQTAEYARAVYRAAQPEDDQDAIDRHIRLRLDRQKALFSRTPSPELVIVLGESVLRRRVGGKAGQAAQLAHLRELDQRDNTEIRFLPYDIGAHAAMTGAFRIIDFDDHEDPDVVYLEAQVGARYLEKPAELAEYRRVFDLVYKHAVPIGEYKP